MTAKQVIRSNIMTKTKRIVRNIFFSQITLLILLFHAVGVFLVGCCTATVLNGQFGSKTSRFIYLAYNFSPDRREIVITGDVEVAVFVFFGHG